MSRQQTAVSWFARLALGAAFLSGIASRFGLWGAGVGYGNFRNFERYTAEVNAFMPAAAIPFLAWAATVAELVLGVLLVLGLWRRTVALASAGLLALFALAMTASMGIKEPLDYSVFAACAAALLLAERESAPDGPAFSRSADSGVTQDAVHPMHTAGTYGPTEGVRA